MVREIPTGPWAILCLQCARRYRSFARYLEHSSLHQIGSGNLGNAVVTGTPGEGFWWRVPAGQRRIGSQWALVAQRMTVQGEPPSPGEELAEEQFTEARGPHVLRSQDVNDTLAVCDLCGSQPVRSVYPARRFLGPGDRMMGGPTSLCAGCDLLWLRGDRDRIFKRVERRISMSPAVRVQIRAMLEELFNNFTGLGVEIGT